MSAAHPLDRPIWGALTTGWALHARGDATALRLDPDFGPFAATADSSPKAQASLANLASDGAEIWLVEKSHVSPPSAMRVAGTAPLVQMLLETHHPAKRDSDVVELTSADAEDMLELATLTQPGPFACRTHEFGGFVGVRAGPKLIAMAGERMRMPGFAEISGVCTHPDARGRGLAGALMSVVARRMIARRETPFLHSYASNASAIGLYERLGFRIRTAMIVTRLVRDPAA